MLGRPTDLGRPTEKYYGSPGKTISPAEELALRYAFLGEDALPDADAVVYERHPEDFYTHKHFDDARFMKRITGPKDQNN